MTTQAGKLLRDMSLTPETESFPPQDSISFRQSLQVGPLQNSQRRVRQATSSTAGPCGAGHKSTAPSGERVGVITEGFMEKVEFETPDLRWVLTTRYFTMI